MTIDVVFRNEKGEELTWEEMDANLANLQVAIETKKDNFSILPVAQGGTGVATIAEAKQVLEVPEFANQIEYMPAGTGAVATDVQSKLRERVSVKDFGAVGDGVTDDTAKFNLAAATATNVVVPKGTWRITSQTTGNAVWILEKGAVIVGLPNAGTAGGGVMDTSRLTGSIISFARDGASSLKVGAPTPWLAKDNIRDTVEYLAEFASVSDNGATGGLFATKSSDDTTANMQTIALEAISYNNNTTNPEPSWSIYTETIRTANAGPSFGAEMDFINLGNTNSLTPYSTVDPYSSTNAPTAHLWLSCGGGDSGLAAGSNNVSAAIVTLPNVKKFNTGWVVRSGSIETQNIVLAPTGYLYTWSSVVSGSEVQTSTLNDIEHYRAVYSDTQALAVSDLTRKRKANGTGATTSGEVIYGGTYQGYSGTADVSGALNTVRQISAISGNTATFTYAFQAMNSGGGYSDVAINSQASGNFAPWTSDNALSLGTASRRWSTVYAGTGTINTSDEREKQDIEELSAAELRVARSLKGLIRKFRFKDAVGEKGGDARVHFGVIAQDVMVAFEVEGLDPMRYGVICYDEWEDIPEQLNEAGEVVQPFYPAGNRYGVRYEEMISFIVSAL